MERKKRVVDLELTVVGGRGLDASSSYCEVKYFSQGSKYCEWQRQTRVVQKSNNPSWNDKWVIPTDGGGRLELVVWERHTFWKDDSIGQVVVNVNDLEGEQSYALSTKKKDSKGSILIRSTWLHRKKRASSPAHPRTSTHTSTHTTTSPSSRTTTTTTVNVNNVSISINPDRVPSMSVKELKDFLTAKGIDHSRCVEKGDLIDLVLRSLPSIIEEHNNNGNTHYTTTTRTTSTSSTNSHNNNFTPPPVNIRVGDFGYTFDPTSGASTTTPTQQPQQQQQQSQQPQQAPPVFFPSGMPPPYGMPPDPSFFFPPPQFPPQHGAPFPPFFPPPPQGAPSGMPPYYYPPPPAMPQGQGPTPLFDPFAVPPQGTPYPPPFSPSNFAPSSPSPVPPYVPPTTSTGQTTTTTTTAPTAEEHPSIPFDPFSPSYSPQAQPLSPPQYVSDTSNQSYATTTTSTTTSSQQPAPTFDARQSPYPQQQQPQSPPPVVSQPSTPTTTTTTSKASGPDRERAMLGEQYSRMSVTELRRFLAARKENTQDCLEKSDLVQKAVESEVKRLEVEFLLRLSFEEDIPDAFMDCITHDIMINPVFTCDGHTYDEAAIKQWLKDHDTSPKTGLKLENKRLVQNHALRGQIKDWAESKKRDQLKREEEAAKGI